MAARGIPHGGDAVSAGEALAMTLLILGAMAAIILLIPAAITMAGAIGFLIASPIH